MSSADAHNEAAAIMYLPQPDYRIPHHHPAMVSEVLELLAPVRGDRALDLTVGTGGHALALAERLGSDGLLIGIDADARPLQVAKARLSEAAVCPFRLFQSRFSDSANVASQAGVGGFDVVLADLGVGTHQLDDLARGFAFDSHSKLDMRFDTSQGKPAWDIVNRTPERHLSEIFWELGEERYSRQIAAAICRRRRREPIDTPAQLADLVKGVVARRTPRRRWRIHPATRVAMAIRIFVNDELQELDKLLEVLPSLLVPGGRIAIITYHSLEARRVKHAWLAQRRRGVLELIAKRPLKPSPEEIKRNPRVRSAQLRATRKS